MNTIVMFVIGLAAAVISTLLADSIGHRSSTKLLLGLVLWFAFSGFFVVCALLFTSTRSESPTTGCTHRETSSSLIVECPLPAKPTASQP